MMTVGIIAGLGLAFIVGIGVGLRITDRKIKEIIRRERPLK